MSEQPFNQPLEDEISLKDIIDFLVESWKVIALGGIIGGLLATGYAFITPPKYQATANIQVARVAGTDVETPNILVEKLKMPMYYSTESYSACNVMDKIEPGEMIAKNLKPVLSKTTPIINFSYKEDSSINAQKCLESVLNDIRSNQNLLAKPILEGKKNQLTNLKQKLEAAERVIKILPNQSSNFDFSDTKFSASALLLATTLSKENEVKDLRTQINDLEIALLEPQTREAFLTTPIYAPKQKVSPRRALILMGGLAAGLFLGLLFMIGKRSLHVYKESSQQ
jgi:uncharacterized protein involved in exopolysaccharide biosynthesis